DVRVSTTVTLRGIDEADLDELENALNVLVAPGGDAIDVDVHLGEDERRPDQTLTVEVPRRLRLVLEGRGVADVHGVAGVTLDDFRGDVTIVGVHGEATGSHREGRLELGEGARVELETRRSTLRLVRPASATLDLEASDVEVMDAQGPVEITQERCTLEVLGGT